MDTKQLGFWLLFMVYGSEARNSTVPLVLLLVLLVLSTAIIGTISTIILTNATWCPKGAPICPPKIELKPINQVSPKTPRLATYPPLFFLISSFLLSPFWYHLITISINDSVINAVINYYRYLVLVFGSMIDRGYTITHLNSFNLVSTNIPNTYLGRVKLFPSVVAPEPCV